jgi:tetratricopeptide (TPR) repeat protein
MSSIKVSIEEALALAEEHAAAGRHAAAVEVLRHVLRVAPDHAAAELALARTLRAQGRLPAAIDFLQSAASRRRSDAAIRMVSLSRYRIYRTAEFLAGRSEAAFVGWLANSATISVDSRPPVGRFVWKRVNGKDLIGARSVCLIRVPQHSTNCECF